MLPSQVIETASTFDLVIMDIAMTLEHHAQNENDPKYVPNVPVEELLKIRERV